MRFATDVGGTFTDLVVEDAAGGWSLYKASTDPRDPVGGVLAALRLAARGRGQPLAAMLGQGDLLIHGTTHALNAIISGKTARTALLTTAGHPDILLLREGGRKDPFHHAQPYPEPYVPRALTFEVPERIRSDGTIVRPLNEAAVIEMAKRLRDLDVEAVAVCYLWSIVNAAHELQTAALLDRHLPGVPYTLSHQLNPVMREYRRASAACIDASLKPLMGDYLDGLTSRLREAGFAGRVLMLTSQGGVLDAGDVALAPIHVLNSGPSMAPVAGAYFAERECQAKDVIVADTGGTTFDVSLVRNGEIPRTRETWIGEPFLGHMTGFPSVDVRSIGAGGGSVAWVDEGGALRVGPESMGSDPGPACYGRGGEEPTVTDAAVVLGYLDENYFLGGAIRLDAAASFRAVEQRVASKIAKDVRDAAAAILAVASEKMAQAILDITVYQGIDPANAVLIGGGGAAGLNAILVARRLGCRLLIIPEVGAALSAAGAMLSELSCEFRGARFLSTDRFDKEAANQILAELRARGEGFLESAGKEASQCRIDYLVEARYRNQVWEIEVPLRGPCFRSEAEIAAFTEDFHRAHEAVSAFRDPHSPVEIVNWAARARCRLGKPEAGGLQSSDAHDAPRTRPAYFAEVGLVETAVHRLGSLANGARVQGPAIIESPFTTVVLDPGSSGWRSSAGNLVVSLSP